MIARALRELVLLGDTANAVAESLGKLGIRGLRQHPRCCALARFLERCFPGLRWTVNDWSRCSVFFVLDGVRLSFQLPAACRAFLRAFDARRYPDLLEAA